MMFGGQTAQLHYWCQPLTHGVFNNTGYYASEEGWGEWFIVMYVHFDFSPMLCLRDGGTEERML